MKRFIGEYLWELIIIVCCILSSIGFVIIGNWWAMVWAIFAGSGEGLYLRERISAKRLEGQFRDYVAKHPAT